MNNIHYSLSQRGGLFPSSGNIKKGRWWLIGKVPKEEDGDDSTIYMTLLKILSCWIPT